MIGYTQTKINKDGSTEIKYFTFNEQTKTYVESAKETRFVDGSYVIKNADGSEEYKWENGNHEIFNKYGKPEIISTTIDDEKITYEIEYDDKGIPTSITVGDRKYTDVILVDDNEQIYDPSKPGLNINEFKHIFVHEKSEDDKTEYPNLSRVQIKQLVEECATLNNIDPDSIITFDTSINNFNINIPKYKIDRNTDKLIFVYEN